MSDMIAMIIILVSIIYIAVISIFVIKFDKKCIIEFKSRRKIAEDRERYYEIKREEDYNKLVLNLNDLSNLYDKLLDEKYRLNREIDNLCNKDVLVAIRIEQERNRHNRHE